MSPRPPNSPVPRIWAGGVAFVIGGGPSLLGFDFDRLRGQSVVAVNAAGYAVPWAGALYFNDNSFFEKHEAMVRAWAGVAITGSRRSAAAMPDLVFPVHVQGRGWSREAHWVRCGRSSGHTAVNIASLLGAEQVILLGFDGDIAPDGRSHFHDRYDRDIDRSKYTDDFGPKWAGMNLAAVNVGIHVFNATPGSRIEEFPMIDLDEILPR